jgi:hypothetical protein
MFTAGWKGDCSKFENLRVRLRSGAVRRSLRASCNDLEQQCTADAAYKIINTTVRGTLCITAAVIAIQDFHKSDQYPFPSMLWSMTGM